MARMFGVLFAYVCVATVLAQAIGLGYTFAQGMINGDKLFRIVAVIHDVDLTEKTKQQAVSEVTDNEEMSYDDKSRLKGIISKNLDLKQQALNKGIENLRFNQEKLQEDWTHYENVKNGFVSQWDKYKGSTQEEGYTNVRLIWEKMKKNQAKNHIMAMEKDGQIGNVVILLSGMPNDKRAKIIKDFTTEAELKVLTDILDLIRRGDPENALIEKTLDDIKSIKGEGQ